MSRGRLYLVYRICETARWGVMRLGDRAALCRVSCYSALTLRRFRGKSDVVKGNDGLSHMNPIKHALWMALLLSACGGNPFLPPDDGSGNGPPGTEGGIRGAKDPITRSEKITTTGNGYAVGIKLNSADDTFEVDGLAFDGGNVYQRGTTVSDIGPFQVYEGDSVYQDAVTGNNIDQLLYRAIYGVSDSGKTNFAIVRTGSYVPYGFGGFIYNRTGPVTLPTSGQAGYEGEYAGLRDFNGIGGLEYVSGHMTMAIDFKDFNNGAGVKGTISDRHIFDIDNNDITSVVMDAINTKFSTSLDTTAMPLLEFTIGNSLKGSGEASGGITSLAGSNPLEKGTYYALIADTDAINAGEVVGVIVVESDDARVGFENVTTRETGGFILLRGSE